MMCPDIQMRKLRLRQAWSFVEGSGGGPHCQSPAPGAQRGDPSPSHLDSTSQCAKDSPTCFLLLLEGQGAQRRVGTQVSVRGVDTGRGIGCQFAGGNPRPGDASSLLKVTVLRNREPGI